MGCRGLDSPGKTNHRSEGCRKRRTFSCSGFKGSQEEAVSQLMYFRAPGTPRDARHPNCWLLTPNPWHLWMIHRVPVNPRPKNVPQEYQVQLDLRSSSLEQNLAKAKVRNLHESGGRETSPPEPPAKARALAPGKRK